MKKMKVLVPIDGTETSLHSLRQLKKLFNAENTDVTLMYVAEIVITGEMLEQDDMPKARDANGEEVREIIINQDFSTTISSINALKEGYEPILDRALEEIEEYNAEKFIDIGYAADRIVKKAKKDKFDMIIMAKSNKKGLSRMLGSVTSKVVKDAETVVLVVP